MSTQALLPTMPQLTAAIPNSRMSASQYALVSFMLNVLREQGHREWRMLHYRKLIAVYYGWHMQTERTPDMQRLRRLVKDVPADLRCPDNARAAMKDLLEEGRLSLVVEKGVRYLRIMPSALGN